MNELDSLSPRKSQMGKVKTTSQAHHHHYHHHSASAPSFVQQLNDCEVDEGESFDMECTTQGLSVLIINVYPLLVTLILCKLHNLIFLLVLAVSALDQSYKVSAQNFYARSVH